MNYQKKKKIFYYNYTESGVCLDFDLHYRSVEMEPEGSNFHFPGTEPTF